MRSLRAVLLRLVGLFGGRRRDRELAAELDAHLQAHIDDNLRAGMTGDEARRQAFLKLGGVEMTKDNYREQRGLPRLEVLWRDLRFGARLLRKSPGFTVLAVLTLALGIGANTAIYTVVNSVLLRPLPYPDPDRLAAVVVHVERNGTASDQYSQTGATWFAVRDEAPKLDVAAFAGTIGVNLVAHEQPGYVQQQRVSTGFFRVLGVSPTLGREFIAEEDRVNGPAVAVLSHSLWVRAFAADPSVLGRPVILRGEPYTIVGVMPAGFRSNQPADVWTPLRPSTSGEGGGQNYTIIARLRPGVTWAEGDGQMASAGAALARDRLRLPSGVSARLGLAPLQRGLTAGLRQPLFILWGAVGIVLLISCVNIAGLLLARGATRAPEIATRMALGGGRAAIVRQLLAESALLAVCGGLSGIVLGYVTLQVFAPRLQNVLGIPISLDARVLAATGAGSLFTSVLFGLLPAFQASRTDVRRMLVESGGTGIAGAANWWPRRAMVVAEVALGVVLLVGAGLLIRTFAHVTQLRPGFDSTNVVTATLSLQDARYQTSERINQLFDRTLEQMRQVPGVERAAVCLTLPYERALNKAWRFVGGKSDRPEVVNLTYVTTEYFDALRIPVSRGRVFTGSDSNASVPVIVVNQAFVERYSRDEDPLGRVLMFGATGPQIQIVGVVGDIQQRAGWGNYGPGAAIPAAYLPAAQVPDDTFTLVHTWFSPSWIVRTTTAQQNIVARMKGAVLKVDPYLSFNQFRTLDDVRGEAVAVQRVQALLLGSLSGLALLLAAIGIYGLVANSVAERTRELGIRIALGATSAQTVRSAALPGALLGCAGVAIGLVLARAGAGVMQRLVFGVSVGDPLTFLLAACAVVLVAGAAALVPSLRILRVNVVACLRQA